DPIHKLKRNCIAKDEHDQPTQHRKGRDLPISCPQPPGQFIPLLWPLNEISLHRVIPSHHSEVQPHLQSIALEVLLLRKTLSPFSAAVGLQQKLHILKNFSKAISRHVSSPCLFGPPAHPGVPVIHLHRPTACKPPSSTSTPIQVPIQSMQSQRGSYYPVHAETNMNSSSPFGRASFPIRLAATDEQTASCRYSAPLGAPAWKATMITSTNTPWRTTIRTAGWLSPASMVAATTAGSP